MSARIATLKAFINISNQQSCVEALCLQLISPLLCGIEIACIQAGTNPWRKAIRWGFHGSSHPFAAPVCSIDNAGAVNVSLLSGEKANTNPSQCSKQHGTAHFKEDQGCWSGGSDSCLSSGTWYLLVSKHEFLRCGCIGDRSTTATLSTWRYLQAMDGLLCWAAESRVHELCSKDSEPTRYGWHSGARQWLTAGLRKYFLFTT